MKLGSLAFPAMSILAEIAVDESRLSDARAYIESALRFARNYAAGYNNLGMVEQLECLKNKAFVNFARALSYEVSGVHATNFEKIVFDVKQYENGAWIVSELLKEYPGNEILIPLRDKFNKNISGSDTITNVPLHNKKSDKFDKINLLYADPPGGIFTMQHGLKTALERNGYLYYSFSYNHNEPLDLQKAG